MNRKRLSTLTNPMMWVRHFRQPKNGKKSRSIRTKMFVLIGLLLTFSNAVAGFLTYRVAEFFIEQTIESSGQKMVDAIAQTSSGMTSKLEAQRILKRILRHDKGDIEGAFIVMKEAIPSPESQNSGAANPPADNGNGGAKEYILRIFAAKNAALVDQIYHGGLALEKVDEVSIFKQERDLTKIVAPIQVGTEKRTKGYVIFEFNQDAIRDARYWITGLFLLIYLASILLMLLGSRPFLKRAFKPIERMGEAAEEWGQGNYQVRLPTTGADDEIGVTTRRFNEMADGLEIFVQFGNPAQVKKILAKKDPDKAEEVKLTIGFGDGVGFSNISTALTATEIVSLLSSYFTLGGIVIRRFDGIIEKFIGDAIMSFFGFESEDSLRANSQNAIRAKLYTQFVFGLASFALKKYGSRLPLQFRFGAATGKCVMGPMGAKGNKMEYTLIGNPVNLAARLEGLSRPGGLKVDKFTAENAGLEDFLLTEAPDIRHDIKGFETIEEGIAVYEVLGLQPPEEDERLREFLVEFFRLDEVKEVLKLTNGQLKEFDEHVGRWLTRQERLVLPAPKVAL